MLARVKFASDVIVLPLIEQNFFAALRKRLDINFEAQKHKFDALSDL